ncbi:MAG: arginine--tRNA ligase [Inconstantimicrobium porci]|uniref:Arginine--tRNA ligase n=1 Tax=Inconstantimicrobium porci TaxID=2652291 RepID=A0A7X2MXA1_9CLOT|nr:arginine--tRNA ligase [Inconstantimicrobium porci]MDD6772262.1 arginine--tRNA ligase [Inconstantimicrobium porci]MDY5911151.1 arginine--tRNA ligase [Inconstantimicrobium porci]MSR90786.1 arginine--tRNA ligase [Inconstantimicrobium porci]
MDKFIEKISYIVSTKFKENGYDKQYGKVNVSNRPDLCQFQCNGALAAAKKYGKAPRNIAEEVVESLNSLNTFEEISIAGPGFINIKVKDEILVKYVNDMAKDKKCGCSNAENPMSIVVDYGGANVAKPLHVGHLRSAIIGESIKRTAKFLGHNVIGDVHLGDWGLQIGMVITEVKRRQPGLPYFDESFTGEYPKEAPFTIDELEDIYPKASKLAKSDENAMLEAREATVELQQGRRGYRALWQHILNVSVADLKKNYSSLNVFFDLWKGESDAQEFIPDMVKYLKDNGYTKESEGALVVDVEEETDKAPIPPFLVLKSDGASLYGTTDLATIVQRVQDYNPDEIIYLADKRQSLHFNQLFRCAKKTHIFDKDKTLDYIGFGTMNGKDGKPFKTREGGVMRLHDLIEIIKSAVRDKIVANNSVEADKVEDTARIVGLAALKYGDLSNQATKDYIFDIDRFAAFEGNTGPYILYTVVRIKSILSKVNPTGEEIIIKPYSDVERDLMLKLTKFNEVIEASYAERAPHKICEYIYDVSNIFNRFYNSNKIVSEEDKEKQSSWVAMITLVKRVIEQCLDLLGIEVPEKM